MAQWGISLTLARVLVRRLTFRSSAQQRDEAIASARPEVPEGIKALGCFLGAGVLAWFGPQVLPNTTLGVAILVVPLMILLFGGAIFAARTFSRLPR